MEDSPGISVSPVECISAQKRKNGIDDSEDNIATWTNYDIRITHVRNAIKTLIASGSLPP